MRKVKFYLETGYVGCVFEDIREYPDDVSEEEIESDLDEWKENQISYGWQDEGEFEDEE